VIKFSYNQEVEKDIFSNHMAPKKDPATLGMYKEQLEIIPDTNDVFIKQTIAMAEKHWQSVSANFYKKLSEFYEEDLNEPEDLNCFLVRTDIYPYNYKGDNSHWFAAPFFSNPFHRNATIRHELCHFFQPAELPKNIKEAIPVILNDQESFLMFWPDNGNKNNEEEQKWRKIIWDIYKKGGKFKDLLKYVEQSGFKSSQ
jgi:hypothetical protein